MVVPVLKMATNCKRVDAKHQNRVVLVETSKKFLQLVSKRRIQDHWFRSYERFLPLRCCVYSILVNVHVNTIEFTFRSISSGY